MSLDSDIALIRRIPLFADLPREQVRLLAFSSARVDLEEGQTLFREGTKAGSGYVLSSGGVELSHGKGTEREVLATCEPGSLIGEIALFVAIRRPATATALLNSQLLEIDRTLILRMLEEYPHLALRLRTKLAERLTATMAELGRVQKALSGLELPRRKPGGGQAPNS